MGTDVVSEVADHFAIVGARSFFGDNIHYSRHGLSIFGVESAADELHLLNGLVFDAEGHAGIIRIGDADAIDHELDFAGTPAANVDFAAAALYYSGLQRQNLTKIFHRQLFDIFAADDRVAGGDVLAYQRSLGHHGHFFRQVQHRRA